jgi:hypothetical protein
MAAHSKTGEQGVLLVAAKLLELGMNPYAPFVDDHGVDIMLPSGLRIQVKAAHLSRQRKNDKHRQYQFSCQQNVYGTGGRARALTWKHRVFAKECDFLVLVGLNENRFWVVPSAAADAYGGTSIILGQVSPPTAEEIKELIGQGKELQDVAYELGCSTTTVWKRKNGIRADRGLKIRELRDYENRWELLANPKADEPTFNAPTIYERDKEFVATLAGPIAA